MEPSERESAPDVEAPREGEPPRAGRGQRVPLGTVGAVVAMCLVVTVAKKDNSPNQPAGTRKEGTSVLHNVQGTPQG